MYLAVRHNWQYEHKVCDIFVEAMVIAQSVDEAKKTVDDEIEDYIEGLGDLEVEEPGDWEELDGRWTRQYEQSGFDYEIIPMGDGFPESYARIVG